MRLKQIKEGFRSDFLHSITLHNNDKIIVPESLPIAARCNEAVALASLHPKNQSSRLFITINVIIIWKC